MKTAFPNLKKRHRSYMVWGIDKETGKDRHIEEVENGLACNCVCHLCGGELMARHGEERIHHFAHVHNRDCCYDVELWCYCKVKQFLEEYKKLHLVNPKTGEVQEVIINLNEQIKLDLSNKSVYPPQFFIEIPNSKGIIKRIVIILNTPDLFDESYLFDNNEYVQKFYNYAVSNEYATLSIKIDTKWIENNMTDTERAHNIIFNVDNKEWIWNEKSRYQSLEYLVKQNKPYKLKVRREDWDDNSYCYVNEVKYQGDMRLFGYFSNNPSRGGKCFITNADEAIWEVLDIIKSDQTAWK